MTIEFKLPDLGEGVTKADVASILVKEGDEISVGQNVLELETEKAVVELPSSYAGRVAQIRVKPGDTVEKGALLMTLEGAGAPAAKAAPAAAGKPAAAPAQAASRPAAAQPAPSAKPAAAAPAQAGGPLEFKLPDLGEGVSKADVASLLVKEGDEITVGQNVLELETEKAVVELPSPYAGRVTQIRVKPGDTVEKGALLMTLAGAGTAAPAPAAPAKQPTAAPPPETSQPDAGAKVGRPVKATAPAAIEAKAEESGNGAPPAPAGPATRRLARELGVDLHRVRGTGPGGRITPEDVQAYVRQLTSGAVRVAEAASAATGLAVPPLPDFTQWGPVERRPMNKIAKTAATNLSLAWQTIPHVTQHELADVTELEAGRKRHSQSKGAAKITMTVLALKAVVAALKQYPHFNASLDTTTNEVIHKQYYHIGVAVDTEQGLLVPVIRDVNQKSILEIARELDTLAAKARERKLSMSDFQGGTFTITNLGGIGGTSFTPIVNYPEVAILGMSRAKQQLVVIDGKPEVRLMLPLSLSYDHRVINGADAARFIVKVAGLLADPSQLLIES
jgi:pyruvate dehydrogenase E2 component (dihydrolipoamide acetyltransferase)